MNRQLKGIRPEMAKHPLAQAAREVNDHAEQHGLNVTCQHYGLKTADVRYIAEQRALRALYAFKGVNLNLSEATVFALSPDEQQMVIKLTAAYMDGLVIGYRAREITKDVANGE